MLRSTGTAGDNLQPLCTSPTASCPGSTGQQSQYKWITKVKNPQFRLFKESRSTAVLKVEIKPRGLLLDVL